MIELPSNLKYIKKRNTLSLTKCWIIIRQDGKQFSFSEHDKSITVDGILFQPSNSAMVSAAEQSVGLEGGNAEIQGFIASEQISHTDLLAGLFNNAQVIQYVVDWKYPFAGYISKTQFVIVQMVYNNHFWRADIEGYSNILSNPVGRTCNRLCPYIFGDDNCGVDTTLYTSPTVTVTDVSSTGYNTRQTFQIDTTLTNNQYNLGTLVFTTGDNALYRYDISSNEQNVITLYLQCGFDIKVGDTAFLVQGCNRSHVTCKTYNNITRFGGFPYVIGRDKMISRPDNKDAN
jgi:uncharacterized phage protein (TIGR02218 family)